MGIRISLFLLGFWGGSEITNLTIKCQKTLLFDRIRKKPRQNLENLTDFPFYSLQIAYIFRNSKIVQYVMAILLRIFPNRNATFQFGTRSITVFKTNPENLTGFLKYHCFESSIPLTYESIRATDRQLTKRFTTDKYKTNSFGYYEFLEFFSFCTISRETFVRIILQKHAHVACLFNKQRPKKI